MITNVHIVTYQRNGMSGTGFYAALLTYSQTRLIVTFEEDDSKAVACRAVERDDLRSTWRGDDIAFELNKWLYRHLKDGKTIYDLVEEK